MPHTLRPAMGTSGLLLIVTLKIGDKQKDFPLVPRGQNERDLVLWVSRYHDDEEFVKVAQAEFEEIEREMQRWLPESELRLCFE